MHHRRLFLISLFIACLNFSFILDAFEEGPDYFSEQAVLDYHQNAHCQFQAAWEELKTYSFFGYENVLDIGCGEGSVTALIGARLSNGLVHGIDLSRNMILFAERNYQTIDYPNLTFSVQDARYIKFNHCFDLVTSFTTLHWIPEQELVLNGVYDCLNDQGRVLFVIPCETPFRVTYWKKQVITSDQWKPYFESIRSPVFRYYTPDEYYSLMESAGFRDIVVRTHQREYLFSSIEDLCSWLSPLLPMQNKLPPELRETFILEIAHVILKDFPLSPDGTITLLAEDLVVEAKKS